MDRRFISLVEEVKRYSIDDIKEKIRTKIYKEIEKLRKDDDEFYEKLERLETNLWRELLENHDSNLKGLVKNYVTLNRFKCEIDLFTNSVNTN